MVGSGDEYETCYETPIGASPIPPHAYEGTDFSAVVGQMNLVFE